MSSDHKQSDLASHWWAARHPPADPTTSFANRTVLITGANSGLGFEAALKFARLGAAQLIFGVRSIVRGHEAKAEVVKQTGYQADNIHVMQLDMASFEAVEKFGAEIEDNFPQVDVAVLNAGVAPFEYTITKDWYETTLQVNVLSTALLALLLLPVLQSSAEKSNGSSHSNLVFVGSASHRNLTSEGLDIGPDDESVLTKVNSKAYFKANRQYAVSKLLVMYVMAGLVELSREKNTKTDVVVTTVCPGLSMSSLFRGLPYFMKVLGWVFMYFFGRTGEQGSRTIVSAATLDSEANGQFWNHDMFHREGKLVTSEEGKILQKRAWEEIKELLKEKAPSVKPLV